jgi:hypothetical protein
MAYISPCRVPSPRVEQKRAGTLRQQRPTLTTARGYRTMAAKPLPTPDALRQLLRYEPETGKLFWLPRPEASFATRRAFSTWNARYAGTEAFTNVIPGGYRTGTIFNSSFRAHRVIWAINTGAWPAAEIDHINGLRDDNRWANLRAVTSSLNKRNCARYSNNTSGHTGVYWLGKRSRWIAKVSLDSGRVKHVGCFKTMQEAIEARQRAQLGLGYTTRHGEADRCPG